MQRESPMDQLWRVVQAQTGPVRDWHVENLHHHQGRYQADLGMIAALAPQGPLLDLAAAPCHMTALLKLHGYAVIGVDIAPQRVGELTAQFSLDVRRCDIEREALPFDDASIACVLLGETFEHLRIDPAFVLSEIHRVLAPGAPLLLTTPNVYSLPSLGRFVLGRSIADPAEEFGKLRRIGHMGHVREYSAAEVARFLGASGFGLESVEYRNTAIVRGGRRQLLRLAYLLAPRRFRRELVIVARKRGEGLRLEPLVPLAENLDCSPEAVAPEQTTKALRFDEDRLWLELADGRVISVPLAWFPRLLHATPEQRAAVEITNRGLHWEALDEDISVDALLAGVRDLTRDRQVSPG